MPKIKLEGMEKLQVKLKKNVQMSDVKRVVKQMVRLCRKRRKERLRWELHKVPEYRDT